MEFGLQKLYEQHLLEEGRRNRYYSILSGFTDSASVDFIVKNAIKKYQRDDRIVWYLRWYKLVFVNQIINYYETNRDEDEELYKKALAWKEKFFQYTLKQNKGHEEAYDEPTLREYFERFRGTTMNGIETGIEHFLSLPVEKIQNYNFGWKTAHIIRSDFKEFEEEWRKKQKEDNQWIDITDELGDEIEIVHKFDDGFYWLDLKKEYCDLEGEAMGHCGNSADHTDGDTVLSLRKLKKVKGQILSRPSLTFILREGGLLGEMKGRENNKPHEKYHPHILTLLKIKKNGQFLVQDIIGGGYLPESNFDLNDLSTEQLQGLYKSRPELRPIRDIYEEDGLTEDLIKKIKEIEGFVSIDRANESVLFDGFDNVSELLDAFDPPSREFKLITYLPYVTGEEFFEYDMGQRNPDDQLKDLYTTVLYKKSDLKEKLKSYIFSKYGEEATEYQEDLDSADEQFDFLNEHDDEVTDLLDRAVDDGIRSGSESEMTKAFKSGLEDLTVRSADDKFEFGFKFTDAYGDGKIYYELSIKEALDLYDRFGGGEYDDLIIQALVGSGMDYDRASFQGDMSVPYYGFNDYDEDYAIERFEELLDEEGILDYSDPDQEVMKLESTQNYLKYF